jgi:hypothetical protein
MLRFPKGRAPCLTARHAVFLLPSPATWFYSSGSGFPAAMLEADSLSREKYIFSYF